MSDSVAVQVNIPQETMNKAVQDHVSEALLTAIDDDSRNVLIQSAIKALLTPAKDGYHKGKTPLQDAFERSVQHFAYKMIEEEFDKNFDLQKEVKDVVAQATSKWVKEDKEKLIERLSGLISNSLYGRY
jgi:hypothetical protein